jgi:4-hydroxythreonine-4-phosphate dehydrogenase
MSFSPILIVWGEPNSIFSEIFINSIKKYKNKKPLVLIGSKELFLKQAKKLKIKINATSLNIVEQNLVGIKKDKINLIDVKYKFNNAFEKISNKSNKFISKCFSIAFNILKTRKTSGLINGPISKKFFLKNRYQGITEYLSKKFNISDNFAMIIYDKKISVSPITTHLPIDKVKKNLTTKRIVAKTLLVNNFYKKTLLKSPKIAICGLNPHCENFFIKHSEEKKIIEPAIKILKKKVFIRGPFPADTIFLENNRKKFDIIIGMYHDQVLAPIKTISEFSSINITIGLPFLRLSPDHGPNYKMVGKNKSNPQSLLNSIKFLDKIN